MATVHVTAPPKSRGISRSLPVTLLLVYAGYCSGARGGNVYILLFSIVVFYIFAPLLELVLEIPVHIYVWKCCRNVVDFAACALNMAACMCPPGRDLCGMHSGANNDATVKDTAKNVKPPLKTAPVGDVAGTGRKTSVDSRRAVENWLSGVAAAGTGIGTPGLTGLGIDISPAPAHDQGAMPPGASTLAPRPASTGDTLLVRVRSVSTPGTLFLDPADS